MEPGEPKFLRDKYLDVFLKKVRYSEPDGIFLENKEHKYQLSTCPDFKKKTQRLTPDKNKRVYKEIEALFPSGEAMNAQKTFLDKHVEVDILPEDDPTHPYCIRIFNKEECEITKCDSVIEYLTKLRDSKMSTGVGLNYKNKYFRGQASFYSWIPSLFREEEWARNEAVLNARVISRHVAEFKDCHSTIERLIKLKHYNQPSRLFDIVKNPLMALYFACDGGLQNKCDGMVSVLFSIPKNEKYSVLSDTVIELSAISNVDCLSQLDEYKKCSLGSTGFPNQRACYDVPKIDILKSKNGITKSKIALEEKCKSCSVLGYLEELAHQCKKESGIESNWDNISFKKINQCIVVHPEMNNPRIIQQQGLFILCGLNPINPTEIPSGFTNFFLPANANPKRFYYYFPYKNLKKIMNELETLGINKSQIYFDLEKTIEYEKCKYLR